MSCLVLPALLRLSGLAGGSANELVISRLPPFFGPSLAILFSSLQSASTHISKRFRGFGGSGAATVAVCGDEASSVVSCGSSTSTSSTASNSTHGSCTSSSSGSGWGGSSCDGENGRTGQSQQPAMPQREKFGKKKNTSSDMYHLTKDASDLMKGSIQAVLDYLADEGVSQASMKELYDEFRYTNHYVLIMERAQEYAEAVYEYRAKHQDMTVVLFLLQAAWEALAKFLALEYQQAHRHYHTLRRRRTSAMEKMGAAGLGIGTGGSSQHRHRVVTSDEVQKALDQKLRLAELCCSSQKGSLLVQALERRANSRLNGSSSSGSSRQ